MGAMWSCQCQSRKLSGIEPLFEVCGLGLNQKAFTNHRPRTNIHYLWIALVLDALLKEIHPGIVL